MCLLANKRVQIRARKANFVGCAHKFVSANGNEAASERKRENFVHLEAITVQSIKRRAECEQEEAASEQRKKKKTKKERKRAV